MCVCLCVCVFFLADDGLGPLGWIDAESLQVTFDPEQLSYSTLIEFLYRMHDRESIFFSSALILRFQLSKDYLLTNYRCSYDQEPSLFPSSPPPPPPPPYSSP